VDGRAILCTNGWSCAATAGVDRTPLRRRGATARDCSESVCTARIVSSVEQPVPVICSRDAVRGKALTVTQPAYPRDSSPAAAC
jgi:hypothetical protein